MSKVEVPLPASGFYLKLLHCHTCYQIRNCDGCGARLRTTYIRTHQRRHCPGREEAGEEADEQADEPGEEDLVMVVERDGHQGDGDEVLHVDEVLALVNDLDQTILGAGIGGRDEEEEEEALALQRRLQHQRLNAERTPPGTSCISDMSLSS